MSNERFCHYFLGLSPDFGRIGLEISFTPTVQTFYVEASCSDRSGDGDGNAIGPVKMDKIFEVMID